jgi:drug/metabolite transporter (DMT)-like permease
MAGAVTAIAGLALLAGLAGSAQLSPAGIMWGLLEAVSLAVSFLLAAAAGETVLPPLVMAWAGLAVGTTFLAVAGGTGVLHVTAAAGGIGILNHRISWVVPVLELSLVSTAIAYVAGIAAARRLGAKLASFTGMAEVFFAVLYAWLLLGQLPSPVEFTGGALMLAGVILVRADENRQRRPPGGHTRSGLPGRELCALACVNTTGTRESSASFDDDFPVP